VEAAGVEPASEKVHRKEATCVSGSVVFVREVMRPARTPRLSPIDLGFRLRTEALALSCKMTSSGPRAGSPAQDGYLKIKQRMQTACWQLLFSDRFTGARNPARLSTLIRSRRIRYAPLSTSILALGCRSGRFRFLLASRDDA
jgi:hypothetical protein